MVQIRLMAYLAKKIASKNLAVSVRLGVTSISLAPIASLAVDKVTKD